MIDSRTLVFTLSVGNIAFALLLFVFATGRGVTQPARLWTLAKLGEGIGFALLALRDRIPDLISIPVGNVVLLFGFALELAAAWVFLRFETWRTVPAILGIGGSVIFCIGYAMGIASADRVIIIALAVGLAFALMAAGFARRWRDISPLSRTVAAVDAIAAVISLARAIWAVVGSESGLTANTAPQILIFVTLYLLMIVNGFGFLLMTKEQADRELGRLATLDSLTEALNRGAFFKQAEAALALAKRLTQPMSAMMLDIDRFKEINDTHGHQTGDRVIKTVVRVCRQQLRGSDLIGRLGGEEFAVALQGTGLEGAMRVAERIRAEVDRHPIGAPSGGQVRFTVSIGVAQAVGENAIDSVLARADAALYDAKHQGRNRVSAAA